MKIRMKFSKLGVTRYIGHLDMLRLFQRSLKRGNIAVTYSQGFNPHPLLSFSDPLPLGYTSEVEYVDIEIPKDDEWTDLEKLKDQINKELPEHIQVTHCVALPEQSKKVTALVTGARYIVTIEDPKTFQIQASDIQDFLQQDQILVMKKTKKGKQKEVDLKPGIYDFEIIDETRLELVLSAGSRFHIKPEILIQSFLDFRDITMDIDSFTFHKEELYTTVHEEFMPIDGYIAKIILTKQDDPYE